MTEQFFARFVPEDLHRLLAHLATIAEPHRIIVTEPTPAQVAEESNKVPRR